MRVNSLEKWNEVSQKLKDREYSLFQMQYGCGLPEGFHAIFISHGMPRVETVTHNQAVHDAILIYRTQND